MQKSKVLFIPTAAIDDDARAVLPKCISEIVEAGIKPENIDTFNCDISISLDTLSRFDAIYFAGGSTKYLYEQIKKIKFDEVIKEALKTGIVYVGASAGSIVADKSHLSLYNTEISVHSLKGHRNNKIPKFLTTRIKDFQALIIKDDKTYLLN